MYILYCMYIQGECTSKINYAFYNVLRVLCFDVIFYFPAALFIYYTIRCDYRVYARVIAHTHTGKHTHLYRSLQGYCSRLLCYNILLNYLNDL